MQITIKIQRYNPDTDEAPYYQEFTVEADPNARLLDALMDIKRFQDGSLGFRKSCAHGVCGSDAMRINGQDGLACKTLVKDVAVSDGDTVVVSSEQVDKPVAVRFACSKNRAWANLFNKDGLPDIYSMDMLPENYHKKKQTINGFGYVYYIYDKRYGYEHQYLRNML